MNYRELIGNRITQARKAKGITIKELSARIKTLSAARISNWEQCTRSPGPEEAKLLSKQLDVAASWLLCLTDSPRGELADSTDDGLCYIPVLNFQEVVQVKDLLSSGEFNSDKKHSYPLIAVDNFSPSFRSKTLFAIKIVDSSMAPDFNPGEVVVIDGERSPYPGDIVLAHLSDKTQNVLRKYGEADECLFQLLAHNELWVNVSVRYPEDASVIGVVVEHRRYL